jgi:hypothetical protein
MIQLESFSGFENSSCRYGLFDRHGGRSMQPFSSLNVGLSVGDSEAIVVENRQLVKERMGVSRLLSGRQVHGEEIFCLESALERDQEVDGFDALITRQRNVGLVIQHADCQAVLLYDPKREAIGAVHSGWRGSVVNLPAKTITAMVRSFGSDPRHLQAVISPSLGPCCAEFVNYQLELPMSFQDFMVGNSHFDFWRITRHQLMECGLAEDAITLPATCTSCSTDYFSYRRACREGNGTTGRNCSVIALFDE